MMPDDPVFVEFWQLYPRRVAKQDARKAWAKLGADGETLQMIRTALEWQRLEWRDPQYIPYPATYLNGRRWEDEPIQKAQTKRPRVVEQFGQRVELG